MTSWILLAHYNEIKVFTTRKRKTKELKERRRFYVQGIAITLHSSRDDGGCRLQRPTPQDRELCVGSYLHTIHTVPYHESTRGWHFTVSRRQLLTVASLGMLNAGTARQTPVTWQRRHLTGYFELANLLLRRILTPYKKKRYLE